MLVNKILVVDDSGVQRKMIIQIIKKAGFTNEILEAADGAIAIETLAANFQDVGLVLCDWNMPN
ncbi:MAG: response regulator, partial [Desulfobacterales bacterium]|nr:response regulator [Desulfobacterales bacterium]